MFEKDEGITREINMKSHGSTILGFDDSVTGDLSSTSKRRMQQP